MERRLVFRTGRRLALARTIIVAEVSAIAAIILALAPPVAPEYVAVLAGLLVLGFLVFGLSPAFTEHWLTRFRVILRQGWYFRAIVPFDAIESLRPTDPDPRRVPLGVHRPLRLPTLYVTGSRSGLVEIRLRAPRRFLQAFGLPATAIVFDMADRPGFLAAYEERRRLFAPVESERPDADLRD